MAALAGEEQAPAALPPTRAHTAAEDAPLPPSAFCSKRSAAPEQEERGADAEAKRLGQHSQQQPPTGPAAATRASRHAAAAEGQKRRGEKDDADADGEEEGGSAPGSCGRWGGEARVRRTCTIKLAPGSYRLQPRRLRSLPLRSDP